MKYFLLYLLTLTVQIVNSQNCDDFYNEIINRKPYLFTDNELQYKIIDYLECKKVTSGNEKLVEKIKFFKNIFFLQKNQKIFIAKDNSRSYIIDANFEIIKIFENEISFYNSYLGILHQYKSVELSNFYSNKKGIGKIYTETIINQKGEIISPEYYDITFLDENNLEVWTKAKAGVVDSSGKKIIPIFYDKIETNFNSKNKFIAKKNNKYAVIDNQNKLIIPFEYDDISDISNKYIVVAKNNLYGVVDHKNNVIVPLKHNGMAIFNDSIFLIKDNYNDYLINNKREVISKEYSRINLYESGRKKYIKIENYGQYGVLNLNNFKEIIEPIYGKIRIEDDYISIQNNGYYGIANFDGEIIIPVEYDESIAYTFDINKLNIVSKNDKKGVIDKENNVILNFEYDNIIIKDDYAYLVRNDKTIKLNMKTKIIEKEYDFSFFEVKFDFVWIKKNDLFGTFDLKKEEIIEDFKYDKYYRFDDGIILVEKNKKFGAVNFKGFQIATTEYDDYRDDRLLDNESTVTFKHNNRHIKINLFGIIVDEY